MTCSTGFVTFSPCMMAWRGEKENLSELPPPRLLRGDPKRGQAATRGPPGGSEGRDHLRARPRSAPLRAGACSGSPPPAPSPHPQASRNLRTPPQPEPGPGGPKRVPPPGPGARGRPGAAHRDGALAEAHAHGAAAPAALRHRRILPPLRAALPLPARHDVTNPRFLYWLPGSVRRKRCWGSPLGAAIKRRCRCLPMALPVEEWRRCAERCRAALGPVLRERVEAAPLGEALRLGCGLLR